MAARILAPSCALFGNKKVVAPPPKKVTPSIKSLETLGGSTRHAGIAMGCGWQVNARGDARSTSSRSSLHDDRRGCEFTRNPRVFGDQ